MTQRSFASGLAREAKKYRLPTEAEWEYACRASTTTRFSFGDDPAGLLQHDWHIGNSAGTPGNVGVKLANPFGLHDMHGNVQEWCSDFFTEYEAGPSVDPVGPSTGANRVVRGGYWDNTETYCRSAYRRAAASNQLSGNLGFRCVCAF